MIPPPLLKLTPGTWAPGREQERIQGQAVHRRERTRRQRRGLARELTEPVCDGRRGRNERRGRNDTKAGIERIARRRDLRGSAQRRRGRNVASDVENDCAGRRRGDHLRRKSKGGVAEMRSAMAVRVPGKKQMWRTNGANTVYIQRDWDRDQFDLPPRPVAASIVAFRTRRNGCLQRSTCRSAASRRCSLCQGMRDVIE